MTSDVQSYFKQVIVQSAPMTIPFKYDNKRNKKKRSFLFYDTFRTYEEYVLPRAVLADHLHCAYDDIACFRAAPVANIIAAQTAADDALTSLDFLLFFERWVPVIDNVLVHGQLYETIHNTSFTLKPLIIGTLTEEAVPFVASVWNHELPPTLYEGVIVAFFKTKASKVLERYPPTGTGDQKLLLARVLTQWVFACTNRIFARSAPSYSYVFAYPFDFDGWGSWTFCKGHVCHGGEIPYEFESAWTNFTDAGRRLSHSMGAYWTNFAKSQDPNEPSPVPISWPKATIGNEKYIFFQDPVQLQEDYLKSDCDFWDAIGYKREYF